MRSTTDLAKIKSARDASSTAVYRSEAGHKVLDRIEWRSASLRLHATEWMVPPVTEQAIEFHEATVETNQEAQPAEGRRSKTMKGRIDHE